MILLQPDVLAIFNLGVLMLWPTSGLYKGDQSGFVSGIVAVLAFIAFVLDAVFVVSRLVHGT